MIFFLSSWFQYFTVGPSEWTVTWAWSAPYQLPFCQHWGGVFQCLSSRCGLWCCCFVVKLNIAAYFSVLCIIGLHSMRKKQYGLVFSLARYYFVTVISWLIKIWLKAHSSWCQTYFYCSATCSKLISDISMETMELWRKLLLILGDRKASVHWNEWAGIIWELIIYSWKYICVSKRKWGVASDSLRRGWWMFSNWAVTNFSLLVYINITVIHFQFLLIYYPFYSIK